jgi:hypothetical protein
MLHADAAQVEQIALRVCDKKPARLASPEYGGLSSGAAVSSRGFSCLLRRHSCMGHVGALMAVAVAMRRLGEVDPAAFRGDPRCVDHEQQVPPGGCDGRGRWHLKEHGLGAGHLNREVH